MTIDPRKNPVFALGTFAWGDSGESGDGYFGAQPTCAGGRRS